MTDDQTVTQADERAADEWYPDRSATMHRKLAKLLARHRTAHSGEGRSNGAGEDGVKAVMSVLWKREQYNGVGPDYDNYRPGCKFDMGGRVERYEQEARDILAALAALAQPEAGGE